MNEIPYRPGRGLCLVERVETTGKIGSLFVPAKTLDTMTSQQVSILAVGDAPYYDADDPPDWVERNRDQFAEVTVGSRQLLSRPPDARLTRGAWVLLKSHSLLMTEHPKHYMIRQDDIIAVLKDV